MQPLLYVKYDAIMIIKGLLTPWWDVIVQVFSTNMEGEEGTSTISGDISTTSGDISSPLQAISLPLFPHYMWEDTWTLHNRWHMSNIIAVAS